MKAESIPCGLCGRAFLRSQLTRHHCRPKEKGGTRDDVALLRAQYHGMVHATCTNQALAAVYPTVEQLRSAPQLQNYRKWVRKLPPTRRTRNQPRRRKL